MVDNLWRNVSRVLSRDKRENMSAVENTGSNGNGDSGWEVGGVSDAANNETEEAGDIPAAGATRSLYGSVFRGGWRGG